MSGNLTSETIDAILTSAEARHEKQMTMMAELLAMATELRKERDELAAWKESMLTVQQWWAEVDAYVRKHPEALLGRSVSAIALEWLKERDELKVDRDRLDWLEVNAIYACMDKTCEHIGLSRGSIDEAMKEGDE